MESQLWDVSLAAHYVAAPVSNDHKYRRGVLACYTGSRKFPGAALLSTEAALATGIGMVRYLGPKSVASLVIAHRPEVVTANGRTDSYLIGSGIPMSAGFWQRKHMRDILQTRLPCVIDAGALSLHEYLHPLCVLTPHAGELAQLLNSVEVTVTVHDIEQNPELWAEHSAKRFGCTVLLKGHTTVIANQDRIIHLPEASARLATAGTGDVLAGIIGGLFALNHSAVTAENLIDLAATGSYIHAQAAKRQSDRLSSGPLTISDLHWDISAVIGQLSTGNTFS